jgi:SAM-dependent methyltransferase
MSDIYDPKFVKAVFDRCSDRYITFSLICSFGFTERWRQQCVAAMPAPQAGSARGYDLMAGTGEVWPHLLKRFEDIGSITAVDISSGMHRRAIERLHAHRAHRIEFIEDDVLASDLPPESADFVISTFGLKTFNPEQHARLAGFFDDRHLQHQFRQCRPTRGHVAQSRPGGGILEIFLWLRHGCCRPQARAQPVGWISRRRNPPRPLIKSRP